MSFIKTHKPCPDCGSSDALSYDDKGGSHCFACGVNKTAYKETKVLPLKDVSTVKSIPDRGITQSTARFYSVYTEGERHYYTYTDDKGNTVAQKVRGPDKTFTWTGDPKKSGLFGQSLFNGGKYVTIVEGELDALACYQLLGSKWPVVSVKNGAQGALKDAQAAYEWLDQYDNIVVCFDADEPGRKATEEVAQLFGGKARRFRHLSGYKDACDYLKAGKEQEFIKHWWNAELYIPDGIIQGSTLYEEVMKPIAPSDVMYPFDGVNELTYGIRKGELVTITAGSGLGKSQFVREIVWHVLNNTEDNIGLLFLEESTKKTGLSIMSLAANKPLHLPDSEATQEEKDGAYMDTLGTNRLYLFDHFGSTGVDNIISRVRYMARAIDCKYVFLDHISIVVSAQSNGDERRAIDEIMTKLRMLVQETGIALVCVSHLKRPEGKGHEEGAATSLSQLRGSGSIAQLSDIVISLERNGQAEDLDTRNTTRTRVLKNRFCGLTGPASDLLYRHDTGRMLEVTEDL